MTVEEQLRLELGAAYARNRELSNFQEALRTRLKQLLLPGLDPDQYQPCLLAIRIFDAGEIAVAELEAKLALLQQQPGEFTEEDIAYLRKLDAAFQNEQETQ